MRFLWLLIILIISFPTFTRAQDQQSQDKIARGIRVIRDFCGTGPSRDTQQQYIGKVEGGITLKRLPGVTAEGSLQYNEREAEGLAGALQKELNGAGVTLSKAQIECMKPFIPRILDALLGPPRSYSSNRNSVGSDHVGLTGRWTGNVVQRHGNRARDYDVELEINGDRGTIYYPSIPCSGKLYLSQPSVGTYVYLEHIIEGRCTDGGVITIRPNEEGIDWRWSGRGNSVTGQLSPMAN